jgi:hypothetical protein
MGRRAGGVSGLGLVDILLRGAAYLGQHHRLASLGDIRSHCESLI